MDEVSKEQLRAIRWLSDDDLVRLITEINGIGWVKASDFLRSKMKEKEKTK